MGGWEVQNDVMGVRSVAWSWLGLPIWIHGWNEEGFVALWSILYGVFFVLGYFFFLLPFAREMIGR